MIVVLAVIGIVHISLVTEQLDRRSHGVMWRYFLDTAKEAPAADVAEVVYGEWKTEQNTGGYEVCMRCSVCGFQFDNWKHIFSYCPACGAKMYGKRMDG